MTKCILHFNEINFLKLICFEEIIDCPDKNKSKIVRYKSVEYHHHQEILLFGTFSWIRFKQPISVPLIVHEKFKELCLHM